MPADAILELERFEPITLSELDATAGLLTREDRKYVISRELAHELLAELAPTHRALEIGGRRSFAYRSVYYDSPSLGAFRAHVQQRRRRYKCRTRHYLDSDLHLFEVKLKGLRGTTIKHQLTLARAVDELDAALAFAAEHVQAAYGRAPANLAPTLTTEYRRITLAGGDRRVTIDYDLSFRDHDGQAAALDAGHVIVESKAASGPGAADLALRRLGVRAVDCSKYCVGVALLRDDVKSNNLQWLLRRYFPAGEIAHA